MVTFAQPKLTSPSFEPRSTFAWQRRKGTRHSETPGKCIRPLSSSRKPGPTRLANAVPSHIKSTLAGLESRAKESWSRYIDSRSGAGPRIPMVKADVMAARRICCASWLTPTEAATSKFWSLEVVSREGRQAGSTGWEWWKMELSPHSARSVVPSKAQQSSPSPPSTCHTTRPPDHQTTHSIDTSPMVTRGTASVACNDNHCLPRRTFPILPMRLPLRWAARDAYLTTCAFLYDAARLTLPTAGLLDRC